MSKIEDAKILTLSTMHITSNSWEHIRRCQYNLSMYCNATCGALVAVTSPIPSFLPEDMADCFSFALKKGANWIKFDFGVEPEDELTEYFY